MNVFTKCLLALTCLLFSGMTHAQGVHGVLRVVKGDVQIKSAKSGQTVKARLGEKVFPKDVIVTAKEARAKIVMVDNNEINVSPDSQVEIQNYEFNPEQGKKDVLLNVIYGKVRSKVEQKYDGKTTKFQIKTPSAVAGVRGTDFLMSFNQADRQSQVVTFEGKVEFGLPGPGGTIANPVFVEPGKVASVGSGQSAPTPPKEMPKEDLAKMEQESKSDGGRGSDSGKSDQRTPAGDGKDSKEDKKDKNDSGDKAKSENSGGDKAKSEGGDKAKADNGGGDKAKSDGGKTAGTGGQSGGSSATGGKEEGGGRQPSSTAGPSPTSGPPTTSAPAGASPGPGSDSMFRPEDFAGGPAPIPAGPSLPGVIQPLPINQLPVCDFCTRVIENNSTKLIIRVNTQ